MPVPGANLVLTIDADLQRLAEKAVAHVAAAAVVVVEPKTGKIRAMRQQAVVRSERR